MSDKNSEDGALIRVMPETLANKIAAGEVVQRPASVAKELIENAIDAGATEISVVIKAAGAELIQVRDNGCGMGASDAVGCFRRHATSKITSAEDLETIHTLGFRGEALASIAAVSQTTLRTRRHADTEGYMVRIHGGVTQASEPCATPPGTSVSVRNLFYNVPARRNFLKSPATEFRHLVDIFQKLAIANPNIVLSFEQDGNEIYRLPVVTSDSSEEVLRHRICDLLGEEYGDQLISIEEMTSYLSITGFIGRAESGRRHRGEQYLFVNDRFVRNRLLNHAVMSVYDGLLPSRHYPFYTLFLTVDPRHVDVNVHPTKEEVKFDDENGVYGFVRAVARRGLGTADLVPQFDPAATSSDVQGDTYRPDKPDFDTGELSEKFYGSQSPVTAPETTQERVEKPESDRLLWQLHNRYVLTQLQTGLMILDQRAAHKRILYESALRSMESGLGMAQQLLFPQTVDLSPVDFALLKEMLSFLTAVGFNIDIFSGYTVILRGVPSDIRPGNEENILQDLLDQYKENEKNFRIKGRECMARSIAQRGASNAEVSLSPKEMRTLIDRLFLCKKPYVSPDNRPTMIRISLEELEKRFATRR